MNYYVMTLFPEMIENGMHTSIIGRAMAKGLLTLQTINIRDFSTRGDGRIDDYPYGGGAGMVMQAEPVYRAYTDLAARIGDVYKRQRSATGGAATMSIRSRATWN